MITIVSENGNIYAGETQAMWNDGNNDVLVVKLSENRKQKNVIGSGPQKRNARGGNRAKSVLCFDTGIKFESAKDVANKLFPDDPVAVDHIRRCCRGEKASYRGHSFRYS